MYVYCTTMQGYVACAHVMICCLCPRNDLKWPHCVLTCTFSTCLYVRVARISVVAGLYHNCD